jgi:3-deoxy-D-manno-octulosonate 8-phosphate phosphatase (KDO 8-P phosphatase)
VVAKRAADLKVSALFQNARYKAVGLKAAARECGVKLEEIAYMGDDLNDLPAFDLAGVSFAPANAVHDVKTAADYVTERSGGQGAVREMVEQILRAQGRWEQGVQAFLEELKTEQAEGETSGVVA